MSAMSASINDDESYLGRNPSIGQLLRVAKMKLHGTPFGGRIATTWNEDEVNVLERDASQVLSVIRSIKNTFAIANKTPPEVLSLIPDYWKDSEKDKVLIKLTHVCRRWREIFISRPFLWTRLDGKNVEKTKVYIERSENSPLEIHLDVCGTWRKPFLLAVPHISRLKTLSASRGRHRKTPALLPILVKHFSCLVPLLKTLRIDLTYDPPSALPGTLFNGDLSSLRKLDLTAVLPPLSWRGLENLTIFILSNAPNRETMLSHLLDFFESAPRLRNIELRNSQPTASNAPPGRIISLPNLRELKIFSGPSNSVLLDHLSIPFGAMVTVVFSHSTAISPIPSRIPDTLDNLHNLSHITAVNLCFDPGRMVMRLNGPSGELHVRGSRECGGGRHTGTTQLLRFVNKFDTSRCQRLRITRYISHPDLSTPIVTCDVYQLLLPMGDLETLTLIESHEPPFILALNPNKNPDKIILCPKLEGITLHFESSRHQFHIHELLDMAKERASRGAKLSVITIICVEKCTPPKEVIELREHVSRVECKFNNVLAR